MKCIHFKTEEVDTKLVLTVCNDIAESIGSYVSKVYVR